MKEHDSVELLKECDSGVKMGVASIDEVLDCVENSELKRILTECKKEHEILRTEIKKQLTEKGENGKEPNAMAKSMSWIKTNAMLTIKESDATVADLITDGANMGVKSLNKYINQYENADENSKNIAKRLSDLEERLAVDIRKYL